MTKSKAGVRPFEASTNHGGASGGTTLAEVVKANPPPSRSSTHSCEFFFVDHLCICVNIFFSLYSCQQKTENGAINAENDEVD